MLNWQRKCPIGVGIPVMCGGVHVVNICTKHGCRILLHGVRIVSMDEATIVQPTLVIYQYHFALYTIEQEPGPNFIELLSTQICLA